MIDWELFLSLRIIWGRYADANGDCIRRDLCSPAGQGVYAKAFYFLLDRYRDENREIDTKLEFNISSDLDLENLTSPASMESPASVSGGLRKYEVSHVFSKLQVSRGSASARPTKVGSTPMIASRKKTFAHGRVSAEKGRSHTIIASDPAKSQIKSYTPTPPPDGVVPPRPKSAALSGLGRGSGMGPFPPVRGYTHSMLPEKRNGDQNTQLDPTLRFSRQLQLQQQDHTKGVTPFARTATSKPPITSKVIPATDTVAKTVINSDPRASIASLRPFVNLKGQSSIGPTNSSTVEPALNFSPTIEEIIKRMNNLQQDVSETPPADTDMIKEGRKSNIPLAKTRRHRKEKGDKENQSINQGWSQVAAETGRTGGVGLSVVTNRDIGKDIGNLPVSFAKMKKSRREYPYSCTFESFANPPGSSPPRTLTKKDDVDNVRFTQFTLITHSSSIECAQEFNLSRC